MPQPLSHVNRKVLVSIGEAGQRTLSERPELAILAMEAISSWSNVESFLLSLFVRLFGGNNELAAKVYLSLGITNAKSSALIVAIDAVEDEKIQKLIKAIIAISKTNQKERDKLAHHIWGTCPQMEDALLLASPKSLISNNENYLDEVYVYKKQDFIKIIKANDRLCGYGLQLKFILDEHPSNEDDQLYNELCSQPEVQDRLNRQV